MPYREVTKREEELREIDKYDILNPDIFHPYVQNLEKADAVLRRHIPPQSPNARDVRHRLLETSGLAGGETNFWANPYGYMYPQSSISNYPEFFNSQAGSGAEGAIFSNNVYKMFIRPESIPGRYSPASRLLAHEGSHQPYLVNYNRDINKRLGAKVSKEPRKDWEPRFSEGFKVALSQEAENPKSPFHGSGMRYIPGKIDTDPTEVMSYLIGREGELRKGQTLLDDPVTKRLFARFPGMYNEYVRARDVLMNQIR